MSRLLSAGVRRLIKEKALWIGMIFMAAVAIFTVVSNYIDILEGRPPISLVEIYFSYIPILLFPLAVFCGLSTGTEYSDGTIRNKLIVGHKRRDIYLCNLIMCILTAALLSLAAIIPLLVLGLIMLENFTIGIGAILLLTLMGLLTAVAVASILTMLCMLNQNKAVASVTAIIILLAMFMAAIVVNSMLETPEYYDDYEITSDTGEMVSHKEKNEFYLEGIKRAVYQFVFDFLPTGQAIQISSTDVANPTILMIYSLIIITTTTGTGLLLFRRKDIK